MENLSKSPNIIFPTFSVGHFFSYKSLCGNYIQRAKIVINDNIIEHVTYFKYLG